MSKTILFLFALLGSIHLPLSAQNDSTALSKPKDSASRLLAGGGVSLPLGGVLKSQRLGAWGVSGGYIVLSASAKNLPSDYDGGNNLFGEGRDDIEKDISSAFTIRLSKQFTTTSRGTLLGLEAGPCFTKTIIADQFIRVPNPCETDPFFGITFCDQNYTYKRVKSNSLGLSLKASVGTLVFKDLLLEFGAFFNASKAWTFLGVDFVFLTSWK